MKFGFEFLTGRCLDIKDGKYTSHIEEKGSQSEVFSRADPTEGCEEYFQCVRDHCEMNERSSRPSAGPKYPLLRISDGTIEFPIFKEPFGIKCVRCRVYGLVVKDCPVYPPPPISIRRLPVPPDS